MRYRATDIDRIAKHIMQMVEEDLIGSGIFYRTFFRCKSSKSLNKKLINKNSDGSFKYGSDRKKLQDIMGVRVNLYFIDDLDLITNFVRTKYANLFEDATIDQNTTTEFKPIRINLIFRLPEKFLGEFRQVVSDQRIDSTFELQLRTVHSEGWHEVEHDLRYKCQNDWEPYPEMSRIFNGYLAALETQEWSMIQLFDQLSHKHYKKGNINALLKTKLRIRFDDNSLSPRLEELIKNNGSFIRELYKLNRISVISLLLYQRPLVPLNLDNIVYIINTFFIKDPIVTSWTPEIILNTLKTTTRFANDIPAIKAKELLEHG